MGRRGLGNKLALQLHAPSPTWHAVQFAVEALVYRQRCWQGGRAGQGRGRRAWVVVLAGRQANSSQSTIINYQAGALLRPRTFERMARRTQVLMLLSRLLMCMGNTPGLAVRTSGRSRAARSSNYDVISVK